MVASVLKTGNFIQITGIDADVPPEDIFKNSGAFDKEGYKIKSMTFIAGADNDKCFISNQTAAGAMVTLLATPDVELPAIRYFDDDGQFVAPFIDFSKGVFSVGHILGIELA